MYASLVETVCHRRKSKWIILVVVIVNIIQIMGLCINKLIKGAPQIVIYYT
jgi:hypothetical protein